MTEIKRRGRPPLLRTTITKKFVGEAGSERTIRRRGLQRVGMSFVLKYGGVKDLDELGPFFAQYRNYNHGYFETLGKILERTRNPEFTLSVHQSILGALKVKKFTTKEAVVAMAKFVNEAAGKKII